ncbi:MAG: single-stranded-DNA-specific exonuclease RecJ [Acidobacteria bacterium]|nr:MAG: single-stranded-DNA-specific exonuclease RecJ [Acidobacteriota bacterium]
MRWTIRSADQDLTKQIEREARLSPLVACLLVSRGVTTADAAVRFLDPKLDHLHSPYLMKGMREAISRIQQAIGARERILIYGDYDVDGTTAIVILKRAIEILGGTAGFHVPHRVRDGYGMKDDVIERAAAEGVRLVISVDTGIRAFAAAEAARRVGLDLIVTDHHLPETGQLPHALAVLNPNQPDCDYPCKSLCGAGIAFKIAQALLEARDEADARRRLLPSFVKMAAIATIADAVPLVGENRVIAKLGLAGLRDPRNPGLRALMTVAQLADKQRQLSASDVAFRIAPRMNAAGRMDVAQTVIELFEAKEEEQARDLAARLNQLNSDRQQSEQQIVQSLEQRLTEPQFADARCIVLDGEGWHRGVIGIAATRVVERTYRPALVISRENGEGHGSGRSIPAFHLLAALESCHELFTRFGGHSHAVGFSLPCERIDDLRKHLDDYARARLTAEDMIPVLEAESEIELNGITPELIRTVQRMEPFGVGNREPMFISRNLRVLLPPKVLKEKHAKLRLEQTNGKTMRFDAMAWRMAERVVSEGILANDCVDVAFTLDENTHPEFGGIELRICDFRRGEGHMKIAQQAAAH